MTTEPEVNIEQDALADLFTLPAPYSDNEQVARWYREIIVRMQREAAGLPMQVNQIQLLERIAFFYAVMRYRELNGEFNERTLKETTSLFLSMFDTFSRSIEKHKDQILRDTIISIQEVIRKVLETVSDDDLRKQLNRAFIEGFGEAGL